jgi:hypothetical protein
MMSFRAQERIAMLHPPLMAAGRADHSDQDATQLSGEGLDAARQPSMLPAFGAGIINRHVPKQTR